MSGKKDILEVTATEAVQNSGFNNLSFRTLADEIGIKSSSVHYYFPEKAHLAKALIEKYTQNLVDQMHVIDDNFTDLKSKLKAFVQIFIDVVKTGKFCLCGMLAAEVSTLSEDNRKLLSQYFECAEQWLSELLDKHKHHIHSNLGAFQLAKVIMSGLEGAILLDRVDGNMLRINAQNEWIDALCK